ncbi:MAG: hypothetical protein GF421_04270 [Candidatus Aminicenantes bacterium]|nr:hypothetical protein [Candidatus Aminicenantes bacterium]
MAKKTLKPLAVAFAAGGVFDVVGGFLFLFMIGTGRGIDQPPAHPFYTVFIGTLLWSFAYLQFLTAFNMKRYSANVGPIVFGRIFYAVVLFAYVIFSKDFPTTFLFTGFTDTVFCILFITLGLWGGLRIRDIFLPNRSPA